MADQKHNEFSLIKKIMIGIMLLNLAFTIYIIMIGSQPSSLSCTQAFTNTSSVGTYSSNASKAGCQLANRQMAITNTTNSLTNSFSCALNAVSSQNCWLKYPNTALNQSGPGCLFSGCPLNVIAVAVIFLANGFFGVITAIFYILALVLQMFLMVTFVLFTLIPSTFAGSSFMMFSSIFQILWSGTLLIIVALAIYLLLNRTPQVH